VDFYECKKYNRTILYKKVEVHESRKFISLSI